ncbi:glycosyl transferase family 1 [Bifidobacterium tissieri]|uniref:Glycosyl transferase family 1 n=1 Tax=Bifidobacterium tissieri TaxID=1630162 RepID=A0A261FDL5_9BIFI|nr:glycosyltransferase [Bifidobacterium tissieri]OZG57222.1 glycosyl transferase family 1 [Bifidobacterium tissieri]
MMKQKLMFIVETVGGGVRTHVLQLLNGLDPEQYDITLVYGERYDHVFEQQKDELAKKVRLILMPSMQRTVSPKPLIASIRELRRVIRDIRPDIVHCHSSIAGFVGRVAAHKEGVPKIFYTPHAYAFDAPEFSSLKRDAFVLMERWTSRHATTRTFNVSRGEYRNALKHHIDRQGKFRVIYNGLPDIELPSRLEARERLGLRDVVPDESPIVGCCAWLNDRKDPMTFMAIANRVIAQRPDVHFVYMGEGEPEFVANVKAYIAKNNLGGNIHLFGYRSDAALLVPAFDVYLLSSLYEGMPYSLVEALRAGVPIAATRTTGNDEVVLPGRNGELFGVGKIDEGVAAVNHLLEQHPETGTLHDQVKQTYYDRFTEQQMLDQIVDEYNGNA